MPRVGICEKGCRGGTDMSVKITRKKDKTYCGLKVALMLPKHRRKEEKIKNGEGRREEKGEK